jgi:RNA polymerase sigma factor (sigma-70 family)
MPVESSDPSNLMVLVGRPEEQPRFLLSELLCCHAAELYGLARRQLKNGAEVDDLVQDTLKRAFFKEDAWGERRTLSYVKKVMINRARELHRRSEAKKHGDGKESTPFEENELLPLQEPDAEAFILYQRIERFVRALSDTELIAVEHSVRGMTRTEIAKLMGVADSTISVHMKKARDKFSRIVVHGETWDPPDPPPSKLRDRKSREAAAILQILALPGVEPGWSDTWHNPLGWHEESIIDDAIERRLPRTEIVIWIVTSVWRPNECERTLAFVLFVLRGKTERDSRLLMIRSGAEEELNLPTSHIPPFRICTDFWEMVVSECDPPLGDATSKDVLDRRRCSLMREDCFVMKRGVGLDAGVMRFIERGRPRVMRMACIPGRYYPVNRSRSSHELEEGVVSDAALSWYVPSLRKKDRSILLQEPSPSSILYTTEVYYEDASSDEKGRCITSNARGATITSGLPSVGPVQVSRWHIHVDGESRTIDDESRDGFPASPSHARSAARLTGRPIPICSKCRMGAKLTMHPII